MAMDSFSRKLDVNVFSALHNLYLKPKRLSESASPLSHHFRVILGKSLAVVEIVAFPWLPYAVPCGSSTGDNGQSQEAGDSRREGPRRLLTSILSGHFTQKSA